MRPRIRLVLYAMLAVSSVTCTDAPTTLAGGGGRTMLQIVPSFPATASQISRSLSDFGLTIDNIHVHIEHPPATPFDTVIAVPAGADSVVLSLPVVLNTTTEQLTVQVELRAGTRVLYRGVQTLTATVGEPSGSSLATVPLVYVGPGAGLAHFTIAPHDTVVLVSGNLPFRIVATDSSGATMAVDVHWTVDEPALGAVNAANATFVPSGTSGYARIVASTPNGLADSALVAVTVPPDGLSLVSGAGQSGVVGTALPQPVVVQARSASGSGVPGVSVAFSGGAAADPAVAVTDSDGNARTTVTLGPTAGEQTITASAAGLTPLAIAQTATAAAPAQVAQVAGEGQSDTTLAVLSDAFTVKVTDGFGNAVPGATVDWVRVSGTGTLGAASSVTNAAGLAEMSYTLGATPGTDTVLATVAGVAGTPVRFTVTVSRPAATELGRVSGNKQSGLVGSVLPLPLVAQATSSTGHPVSGATITWVSLNPNARVSPATSTTDSLGHAATTVTLPGSVGPIAITASLPNGVVVEFVEQATAPAPDRLRFLVQPSDVVAGTMIAPSIQVEVLDGSGGRDSTGAAASAPVALSVLHGPTGGQVTGSAGVAGDTVRAVKGIATFQVTNDVAGTYTLLATSPGLISDSSAAYTVSPGTVLHLSLVAGASLSGDEGDTTDVRPTVRVTDAYENPVPGVELTWAVDSGGGGLSVPNSDAEPSATLTTTTNAAGESSVLWTAGFTRRQVMHVSNCDCDGNTVVFAYSLENDTDGGGSTNGPDATSVLGTPLAIVLPPAGPHRGPPVRDALPVSVIRRAAF